MSEEDEAYLFFRIAQRAEQTVLTVPLGSLAAAAVSAVEFELEKYLAGEAEATQRQVVFLRHVYVAAWADARMEQSR